MSTTPPRIAIIGAGIGGLTLLAHLHRLNLSANTALYERDVSFSSRSHLGGTLDLHYESGQRAIREAGLWQEFQRHARPEGEEMRVYDKAGNLLLFHGGEYKGDASRLEHSRPEIDRSTLRKLLLDVCPASSIVWDHSLLAVKSLPSGEKELTFANGKIETCDFLIGADGAHSQVRPHVSPQHARAAYTGLTGAEVSLTPEAVEELGDVAEKVGMGSAFCFEAGKALLAQRNGDGRIRTYAFIHDAERFSLPSDPAKAREVILSHFSDWAPWHRTLITRCDPQAIYVRALYALPVGHRWKHIKGVTLLGDAAHLMSPFAGEGANLAMLDGLELALAISQGLQRGEGLDAAVQGYEEKMFVTAEKAAQQSEMNLEAFMSVDAPRAAIERMREIGMQMGIKLDKN